MTVHRTMKESCKRWNASSARIPGLPVLLWLVLLALPATAAPRSPHMQDFLPFQTLSLQELQACERKVLTHLHSFILAFNNARESEDHYTTFRLNPDASEKHKGFGGQLRQRPYYRPVRDGDKHFFVQDYEAMLQNFVDIGGDIAVLNIFTEPYKRRGGGRWHHFEACYQAAENIEADLSILPCMDCACYYKRGDVEDALDVIEWASEQPSTLRMDDRLVFSAWWAGKHPVSYWKNVLAACRSSGIDAAFFPCWHTGDWEGFEDISIGIMKTSFGVSYDHHFRVGPPEFHSRNDLATRFHKDGFDRYVHTIRGNDARAHCGRYFEPANFRNLRKCWQIAIDSVKKYPQDWAQIYTWNDIHENQGMQPFTGIQYALYDLNAYYVQWFKTGKKPGIVKDALYYSHRRHHMEKVKPDFDKQTAGKFKVISDTKSYNDIELLAFLTEPGTLRISVGDKSYRKQAEAGLNSFVVPLTEGLPRFALERNGRVVVETVSKWPVSNEQTYEDPLYRAGGSLRQFDFRHTYVLASKQDGSLLCTDRAEPRTEKMNLDNPRAHWRFEPVVGTEVQPHYTTVYVRISKPGDPDKALYLDDGDLVYGAVARDDKQAMWEFVRNYNSHDQWIKNAADIDLYITNELKSDDAGLDKPMFSWKHAMWNVFPLQSPHMVTADERL